MKPSEVSIQRIANTLAQRQIFVFSLLSALLLGLIVLALLLGSYPLSFSQLLPAAQGKLGEVSRLILMDYRLPRILTAILVGMAFAVAGAIFQTLMRNPLASPDVVGFSAGAGVGALVCLMLQINAWLVPAAITGGLISAFLVIALAWRGGISTYRLILVGIGMNFILGALVDLMLSRIDLNQAVEVAKWLTGNLNYSTWHDVSLLVGGLCVLLPIAYWLKFSLERLALGQDIAIALGVRINPANLALIVTSVLFAAFAVSVSGPLPFVAFAAGPIARSLLKNNNSVLFTAALVGASISLLADIGSRATAVYVNVPTGVFTAFIGAPYLLWLLIGQIRRGQL